MDIAAVACTRLTHALSIPLLADKVETIGDSYLCVSGMLPERADHACAALRLGLDMHAAAASVEIGDGRCVQVRVGMHSGEVTSGIIGHVRARFCLFGGACPTLPRVS